MIPKPPSAAVSAESLLVVVMRGCSLTMQVSPFSRSRQSDVGVTALAEMMV